MFIDKPMPLKNGVILQQVKGPFDVNCPTLSSRKTSGKPIAIKKNKYGIKKTPPPFL